MHTRALVDARRALWFAALMVASSVAHAQQLDTTRTQAIAAQVTSAYAVSSEADFTEGRLSPGGGGALTWRGHATFTKTGFVLEYTIPPGRRVVSDMRTTRILDPSLTPTTSRRPAPTSFYNRALSLMTGTADHVAIESAQQNGSTYTLRGRATFIIDAATSHVLRVITFDTSTGNDLDTMNVDMTFTNIRSLPTPAAASRLDAALRST